MKYLKLSVSITHRNNNLDASRDTSSLIYLRTVIWVSFAGVLNCNPQSGTGWDIFRKTLYSDVCEKPSRPIYLPRFPSPSLVFM